MDEVWSNDIYECQVRYITQSGREGITEDEQRYENPRDGALHLSIKRWNRQPVRDWRHLQSIKNEVAGPFREALEIFPDERRLVDGANQHHLWVLPVNLGIPLGFTERAVGTQEEIGEEMRKRGIPDNGKARQRAWQPGLSTGPDYEY
jgi:hypothetical protein